MKLLKILILVSIFLSFQLPIWSQIDHAKVDMMTREEIMNLTQDELLSMSLEDLMLLSQKLGVSIDELLKMKTSVASKTALTPKETPGIISIITEEEIHLSGARDLIDILRQVPGFDFGYDVQGVVGAGLRGNWVHEGKILMMIDGQEMNEISYNNLEFGNHISVDQIKRIEIIRGPGSSIYGGNAELGVINIISKSGEDIKGVEASATYGQLEKSMGRLNFNFNSGIKTNDWDISVKGFYGLANRTDQLYAKTYDANIDTVNFSKGGSQIETNQFNFGATNEKLSIRLIYDDYKTKYVYHDDDLGSNVFVFNQFRSLMGEIKYNYKINEKLTLIPKFNYKYNRPYYEESYWRNFYINRLQGNITLNYSISKNINIVAGTELMNDNGKCIEEIGYFYSDSSRFLKTINSSVFADGLFKLGKINITVGGRVENNNKFGWATAPRIGITGVFNKFHFKTLVSGAFRSPSIGNIDLGNNIKPERSLVSEIELGYRINDNMFITSNFYDINIYNCIVYYDDGDIDSNGISQAGVEYGYKNAQSSGADGFEIEFKTKYSKGFATINYSYYTLAHKTTPDLYKVISDNKRALGLSSNKISFFGSYMPVKNLALSTSLSFYDKRFAYSSLDENGDPVLGEFDPYFLLNFSVAYDNFLVRGLNVSLSVFDILNQIPPYLQPYNGWEPTYPGRSREILLKMKIDIDAIKQ